MSENSNANERQLQEQCLFDKGYRCPVCEANFKARAVRYGKTKLIGTDTDLRPYYKPVDPIHYDVLLCPQCGYASIIMSFDKMTESIADKIKETISPKFLYIEYPSVYNAQIGIERYKMALEVNKIRGAGNGETAYIHMKMAWLYRELKDKENELRCIKVALENFKEAFQKERFPICGIEEMTYMYILGEMELALGNDDEALRWYGKVITNGFSEPRLKQRAIDQKEMLRKKRTDAEEQATAQQEDKKPQQTKVDNKKEKPRKKLFGIF